MSSRTSRKQRVDMREGTVTRPNALGQGKAGGVDIFVWWLKHRMLKWLAKVRGGIKCGIQRQKNRSLIQAPGIKAGRPASLNFSSCFGQVLGRDKNKSHPPAGSCQTGRPDHSSPQSHLGAGKLLQGFGYIASRDNLISWGCGMLHRCYFRHLGAECKCA